MNGLCPEADKLYLALNQARNPQAEFAALILLTNHRLACVNKDFPTCHMTDEQARQAVQAAMGVRA